MPPPHQLYASARLTPLNVAVVYHFWPVPPRTIVHYVVCNVQDLRDEWIGTSGKVLWQGHHDQLDACQT